MSNHNISYDKAYDNKLRFIVSPCSPIVLIPGIYSTKLKVKLNCKNLNLLDVILLLLETYSCAKENKIFQIAKGF